MTERTSGDWYALNQRYLMAALEGVREALEAHAAQADASSAAQPERRPLTPPTADELATLSNPPALSTLVATFGLSDFERDVLVMAAGMELEGSFSALCAKAQGDASRAYPTFGLALAALPGAEWAALTPGASLRRWLLIEVGPGNAITSSPLRIDETILHHLTGVRSPDERLVGLSTPMRPEGDLAPSHQALAEEIAQAWSRTAGSSAFPVVQLCGREVAGKTAVAAEAARLLGLRADRVAAVALPTAPADLHKLVRLWNRESLLDSSALFVDCEDLEAGDVARDTPIRLLIDDYNGPLFVSTRKRRPPIERPVLTIDVERPRRDEQQHLWQRLLADARVEVDGHAERLVGQFDLSYPTIRAALAGALGRVGEPAAEEAAIDSQRLAAALWHSCRTQARPRLDDLAERIRRAAAWDQLVLPAELKQTLRQIEAHVRHQAQVYETWGLGGQSSRGLGISALFAGPSGTGKTMAAEVLARELDLDLYRIDLSAIVSKYIGETEKNLARVFDAAEEGGAILLFDEADALFGRRSEVKDSHDRHANVEVSYLLQRIESYRGLAILTSNMRDALDAAFLRRLRFILDFPFPDTDERALIWRRVFPAKTPTRDLDFERLAQLSVTGGKIRNIAVHAAFLAAEGDSPVTMGLLRRAAEREYEKVQEALPQSEVRGWR